MYLDKLKKILKIPENHVNILQWESVQNECVLIYPAQYKQFLETYGAGTINKFILIFSPFENNENTNLFSQAEVMRQSYNYMKDFLPDRRLYSIYPDYEGILPWGRTENGDELYSGLNDDSIVVFESRYSEFYEYSMGIIEFLYKLLTREIKCDAFPNDFFRRHYEYFKY